VDGRALQGSAPPGGCHDDLASLIRTGVLLAAQDWRDHDDAPDALRHDSAFRLVTSSSAGLTPLADGVGLASQPTLLRFAVLMSEPASLSRSLN
jgi:hypothetical protein